MKLFSGAVAQLVEHRSPKPGVWGSIPHGVAKRVSQRETLFLFKQIYTFTHSLQPSLLITFTKNNINKTTKTTVKLI